MLNRSLPVSSILRALVLSAPLAIVACGGGGSSSGGTSSAGGSTTGGQGSPVSSVYGSQLNQARYQTALAALAQAPAVDPVRLEQTAMTAWKDLFAKNWPGLMPLLEPAITNALLGQVGQDVSGFTVRAIRNVQLDFLPAPCLEANAPAPQQTVTLHMPRVPEHWSLSFTADLEKATSAGPVIVDLSVAITDIRLTQPLHLDLTDPAQVALVGPGNPTISLRLSVSSNSPLVSPLASAIAQALDPIVRIALIAGSSVVRNELGGVLAQLPQGPTWGLGGPGVVAVPGAQPLEPLAIAISDEIQKNHMPFGQVYPANFPSPTATDVSSWSSHGDSAIWTGHYLAGEAYRFDLTGDARAFTGAQRATDGIGVLLDVARQGDGLLSRAAIPSADPAAQHMSSGGRFIGFINGVQYDAKEIISRDQYIGVVMGLGQTFHRIPTLRPRAAHLMDRIIAYLESTGWNAQRANFVDVSVTFVTAPSAILAFTKVGALSNPTRWQSVHDGYTPMASMMWLNAWFSAREVHESYYKFNLSHGNLVSLFEFETDPLLYRQYLKVLRMTRTAIGHHQNAWFDSIKGMAIPTQTQSTGALVKDELDRWSLRPRRGHSVQNSQNPAIQQ
ncbi:MAG: hypothetical protein ACYS22_14045, partial [Planctomycetota bacterium]